MHAMQCVQEEPQTGFPSFIWMLFRGHTLAQRPQEMQASVT